MMERVFQKVPAHSSSIFRPMLDAGVQRLNRILTVVFVATLLLATSSQLALASTELVVDIGQRWYNAGDTVAITGIAPAGSSIEIIMKRAYELVYTEEVVADSSGEYGTSYSLPSTAFSGFYTIMATSGSLTSEVVFVVTEGSIAEIARQHIETAEQSRAMSERTVHEITNLGNTVPTEATSSMIRGMEALSEAKALHAEGEYGASADAAQLAMNQFGNAMTLAIRNVENRYEYVPSQDEVLTNRVQKLNDQVERLSAVITSLSDSGEDVAAIEALIEAVKTSLESALSKIDEGLYEEAAEAIATAQKDLQEVNQLIQPLLMDSREGLMEQFKNRLRERIIASIGDLEQLQDQVPAANMVAVMQRLGDANGLVFRAETRLQMRLDDEALGDLEAASNEFALGLRAVDNSGLSQGLMQVNMVRCQIQIQQGIAERLRRRGEDTSAVDAQIQNLQTLVENGIRIMKQGDYSGASRLFENAQQGGHYYGGGAGYGGSGKGGGGK